MTPGGGGSEGGYGLDRSCFTSTSPISSILNLRSTVQRLSLFLPRLCTQWNVVQQRRHDPAHDQQRDARSTGRAHGKSLYYVCARLHEFLYSCCCTSRPLVQAGCRKVRLPTVAINRGRLVGGKNGNAKWRKWRGLLFLSSQRALSSTANPQGRSALEPVVIEGRRQA